MTLVYSIGNLKNSTTVSGVTVGELDSMSNQFAGRFSSKLQAGIQVERKGVSGGLQFGLTKGSLRASLMRQSSLRVGIGSKEKRQRIFPCLEKFKMKAANLINEFNSVISQFQKRKQFPSKL